MLEFTGERMVPGLAADALFNEHFARYRFAAHVAARFGPAPVILDAGCGAGYGSAEFSQDSRVAGIDVSYEAVAHARASFVRPGLCFLQAPCESLPFADGSFDLIVAFEVIEHLERWPEMLREALRCLKPAGALLVSTPNKEYYAESRSKAGPNPFHVHEFEYGEFAAALGEVFPHVKLWTQNRAEAMAFLPDIAGTASALDAAPDVRPNDAHFLLAACSRVPIGFHEPFAWLPRSGNLLRERDRHIALLEDEVRQKTAWLEELEKRHADLNHSHESLLGELRERNEWAARLDDRIRQAGAQIAALQSEIDTLHKGYTGQIGKLNDELAAVHEGYRSKMKSQDESRLAWIADLERQIAGGQAEIERLTSIKDSLEAERAAIFASRWFQIGQRLNVGPRQ